MRLLRSDDTRTPGSFVTFGNEDEVPPYAILSHTWHEGEEVTYNEMVAGSTKYKAGYDKIRFCAQQAKDDGLEYFWVDTCCINKADQVELRDALSAMFRWYQRAARCYVFLSDFSVGEQEVKSNLLQLASASAFRASKWFTRGWTLQELLAPELVQFFSKEWRKFGDKTSLQSYLCDATRIPAAALQGAPLSQFSINERLKWSEHRTTKLPEDRAYCLMGILGVYITPFEGEGVDGAFKRLMDEVELLGKVLRDVRLTDPRDDKTRIEETKGGLLEGSYRWILHNDNFQQWRDDPQSRLLWIKGDPGKGKTMLLCGIINELQKSMAKSSLMCYFFCQATDSRINSAVAVLRGLLYLLISQQPWLAVHVREKYDHAGKSLFEDANAWVVLTEIFTNMLQDPSLQTVYLVVDALDECVTGMPRLLEFLATQSSESSVSSRIKWIVSSRNWPDIEEKLERAGHKVRLSLELNAESVSAAVAIFIEEKVSQLGEQKKYDDQLRCTVLEHLMSNANDTFLWVALVCQDLRTTARRNVLKRLSLFPAGLDSLYGQMMQQISKSDDAEVCKQVLASIALVYRPVTLEELVALVEEVEDIADDSELREIIGLCGSFLTLRKGTVYFVHQSAQDFLLDRAMKEMFPSGKENVHYAIFARSLKVLTSTLRRDMYDLKEFGYAIEDVKEPVPDPLAASRYSCIYWIDHLCASNSKSLTSYLSSLEDRGDVDVFLREKFLYWLEALSLCRSYYKGVASMAKLWSLVQERSITGEFFGCVQDAHRFIMYSNAAIKDSPLQAYTSALMFSPKRSVIRTLFQSEEPGWISMKPARDDSWSACLQTLEGHSSMVSAVAFSHDSTRLVSGSEDKSIKVWDTGNGECLLTLNGHSTSVIAVAFAHNSTKVASASRDLTINIWDTRSGTCCSKVEGNDLYIDSLAFSFDLTQLAWSSMLDEGTIKIRDTRQSECLFTLKGHSNRVGSLAFSRNSRMIASASYDKTVKIWDASSGECLSTLRCHIGATYSLSFSPDSTLLASVSLDIIKIWNVGSSTCIRTLQGHNSMITSVTFSHDSTLLASGSSDNTIKVWDTSSGERLSTFQGHNQPITSVAFSHDSTLLASTSLDNTVKVWDASSCEELEPDGHSDAITSVTFSHNLAKLASGSLDGTVKVWDVNSSKCLTLEGHRSTVTSVAFTQDSAKLASGSWDGTIKIWDMNSGECLTLEGHRDRVTSLTFSQDSVKLASGSYDRTIKVWDVSSGECLTLEGHSDVVASVAFTQDSAKLASGSWDKTVKIWDMNSGECLTLEGHRDRVTSVAFSQDSVKLASGSYDRTTKVWDVSSGACLLSFETDIGALYISTASSLGPTSNSAEFQNAKYRGLGLSDDGVWMTYNSKRLVWLPSEYRRIRSAVSGNILAIGTGSSRVWIFKIQPDKIYHR